MEHVHQCSIANCDFPLWSPPFDQEGEDQRGASPAQAAEGHGQGGKGSRGGGQGCGGGEGHGVDKGKGEGDTGDLWVDDDGRFMDDFFFATIWWFMTNIDSHGTSPCL